MKIKNLQITSPSTLDLELDITCPICILRGEYAALTLDLIRELIGDYDAENNPDRFDDGHFVIHSDIEIDGKNYTVCYIRNADFLGDNHIAANFVPNSLDYAKDDTVEFVNKCNERDKDSSNVLYNLANQFKEKDDRPLFVYHLDKINEAKANIFLDELANSDRQVFIALCDRESIWNIEKEHIQMFTVGEI